MSNRTPVKVYFVLAWTFGFLLIFFTTELKLEPSEVLTEAQKLAALEKGASLDALAAALRRRQISLLEETIESEAKIQKVLQGKVDELFLTPESMHLKTSEAVDAVLAEKQDDLNNLNNDLKKLVTTTISKLALPDSDILELINGQSPEAIKKAISSALAENQDQLKSKLTHTVREIVKPDPAVITPGIISDAITRIIQRELENPAHMQFKDVSKWKAKVISSVSEHIKSFDWDGTATILKDAETITEKVMENYMTSGNVQKIAEDSFGSTNISELEELAAKVDETQRYQAQDINTVRGFVNANNETLNKFIPKVDGFEKTLEELKADVERLVTLRETFSLKETINSLSTQTVDDLFQKLSESNAKEVTRTAQKVLDLHSADDIAIPDYASHAVGGRVYSVASDKPLTRDTISDLFEDPSLIPEQSPIKKFQTKVRNLFDKVPTNFDEYLLGYVTSPEQIINPSLNPGECWPFPGDKGNVTIALAKPVTITEVTLDYIPASIAVQPRKAAPRDFEVYGINRSMETGEFSEPALLYTGVFEVKQDDISSTPPRTTFQIPASEVTYSHVRLRILSNYGATYTCIYRFRVHSTL
eukprot:TRINITY_DN6750_c0_g1_i1.p1 TRINITY_DN6750_c0_g1~~TRINITY_DN6750_c0_g1_i1.p1  ORF type:complete len:591 (-),score=123.13 TRINITY_DN6750_c0_g1_i1:27-1799(-)